MRSSGTSSLTSQCRKVTLDGRVAGGGAALNEMSSPTRRADLETFSPTSKSQILTWKVSPILRRWIRGSRTQCPSLYLPLASRVFRSGSSDEWGSQRSWSKDGASGWSCHYTKPVNWAAIGEMGADINLGRIRCTHRLLSRKSRVKTYSGRDDMTWVWRKLLSMAW